MECIVADSRALATNAHTDALTRKQAHQDLKLASGTGREDVRLRLETFSTDHPEKVRACAWFMTPWGWVVVLDWETEVFCLFLRSRGRHILSVD